MPTSERVKKERIAKMEALISGLLKKDREERAAWDNGRFGLRRPMQDPRFPLNPEIEDIVDPHARIEEGRTLGKTCIKSLGQILSKTPVEEKIEFLASVAGMAVPDKKGEEKLIGGIEPRLPFGLVSSLVSGLVRAMKDRKNELGSSEFKQGIDALISLKQAHYYLYSVFAECKNITKENPEYMLSILPELVKQNVPVDLKYYFNPEYWDQVVAILEEIGPRGVLAAARTAVKSEYGEAGVDGRVKAKGHVPTEIGKVLWPAVERVWNRGREDRSGADYSGLSDLDNGYFYPWSDEMKLRLLSNSVNEKTDFEVRLKDLAMLAKAETLTETEILSLMGHPLLRSEYDSKRRDGVEIISALFRHPNLKLNGVKKALQELDKLRPGFLKTEVEFKKNMELKNIKTPKGDPGRRDQMSPYAVELRMARAGGEGGTAIKGNVFCKWPELIEDKAVGPELMALLHNKGPGVSGWGYFGEIINQDGLLRPSAARAGMKALFDSGNVDYPSIQRLLEFAERRQDIIPRIPWDVILEGSKKVKMNTVARFKLQAFFARGEKELLPEGMDPIGLIIERIKRIKSGNTAAEMLMELSKDDGIILKKMPGEWIVHLMKLGSISAQYWYAERWGKLIDLKSFKMPGEEEPRLLADAMRVFLRPHISLKQIGLYERGTTMNDKILEWFLPPFTSSSELPKLLGQLSPQVRKQLVSNLYKREYTTQTIARDVEEVVADLAQVNYREEPKKIEAPKATRAKPKKSAEHQSVIAGAKR